MTPNSTMTRASILIIGVVATLALSGCATLRPWQRGRLADSCMVFDADGALVGYMTHWQEAREGSKGGYGVQSGGCGCK
jgi:hypothetical protein